MARGPQQRRDCGKIVCDDGDMFRCCFLVDGSTRKLGETCSGTASSELAFMALLVMTSATAALYLKTVTVPKADLMYTFERFRISSLRIT